MLKNWSGNIVYSAEHIKTPTTIDELQEIITSAKRVKVIGSRHSFNRIADTDDTLISLETFKSIEIDETTQTVTVGAGVTYGDLAPVLQSAGFALHNLASLPHISVVGAVMTGTHGSGVKNQNLSSAVVGLAFISGVGEQVTVDKTHPDFSALVVGLGAFGIVTGITLAIEPTYDVQQDVYTHLPVSDLHQHFEIIMSSGYSVSLFTEWRDDTIQQIWRKRRVDCNDLTTPDTFYGATLADRKYHPIASHSAEHCTDQQSHVGAWHQRLPHFKMGFIPSSGEELQSEYFVAGEDFWQAFARLNQIRKQIAPVLLVSEIRTIASDDLWLSPCYGRDSVAFHFTWQPDWDSVQQVLPQIETALAPFDARPHWGKLFTLAPANLHMRYQKIPDFRDIVIKYDPNGKFRNAFLEQHILV